MAVAVLFDAVLLEHRAPHDPRMPQLVWWAARFAELGFTPSYGPGDHGNLSCRTAGGLLITARETSKASLRLGDFVEVLDMDDVDGRPRVRCRGVRLPSTDTLLHLKVYRTRPDVQAILHGHDVQALARAAALRLPVTIPSARVSSHELIDDVCRLATETDYLLLREHGFLALGRSIDDAGELVRRVALLARSS